MLGTGREPLLHNSIWKPKRLWGINAKYSMAEKNHNTCSQEMWCSVYIVSVQSACLDNMYMRASIVLGYDHRYYYRVELQRLPPGSSKKIASFMNNSH
jgi:hypothetical protein